MWPTIIIARQIATKRVKAELAAQGIKLRQVKALDIKRWADAYLNRHAELLAKAEAKINTSPELRKLAERQQKLMLRLNAKATCAAWREASPAPPRCAPWLANRLRQRQQIEEAVLRAVQKTSQQRRAKTRAKSKPLQFDLWPTETVR